MIYFKEFRAEKLEETKEKVMEVFDDIPSMCFCDICAEVNEKESCDKCCSHFNEPCVICTQEFGQQQKLKVMKPSHNANKCNQH